jgi:hypothetical protein
MHLAIGAKHEAISLLDRPSLPSPKLFEVEALAPTASEGHLLLHSHTNLTTLKKDLRARTFETNIQEHEQIDIDVPQELA